MDELYMGVVSIFAGDAVNMFAQGPDWGNLANIGAKLAAKDAIASMGGVPLTKAQSAEVKADAKYAMALEQKHKSFFARNFDLMDAHSTASMAMLDMPQSPGQAIASIFKAPATLVSTLFRPVAAQDTVDYDYGFDDSGFTIAEQKDPRFGNPYANAEIIEPQLEAVNAKYGDCFSMEVTMTAENKPGLIIGQALNPNKLPDECKRVDANNDDIEDREDFLRYRFYLADTISQYTEACAEKDQSACLMLVYGINGPAGPVPTGATP
jgi:hypothetical protein